MSKTACEVLITNGCAQRFRAAEGSRIRLWAIVLVLVAIIGGTAGIVTYATLDISERLARVEERVVSVQKAMERIEIGCP